MPEVLDTIAAAARTEIVVTKSRFIADLVPVTSADEAAGALAAARKEFHDARHHVSAWVVGPQGEQFNSSDDGEPSGTSGAPSLAVLQGERLTDVAVVVTRYFGGTLLGAGGLVRAYGGAVTEAVSLARRVRRRQLSVFKVHVSHADAGQLENRLRHWASTVAAHVEPGRYGATDVTIEIALPEGADDDLRALLDGGGIATELKEVGPTIVTV